MSRAWVSAIALLVGIATGLADAHAADADLWDDTPTSAPTSAPASAPAAGGEDVVVEAAPVVPAAGLWPASATVISGEELRRRGFRSLEDALRFVAGLELRRSTRSPELGARGVPGGVALVVDGVPLTPDPDGNLPLDELDLGEIALVEIVRGPASPTVGMTALTAVVRVTTASPGVTGAGARASTTHLGGRELAGRVSVRRGAFALRASLLDREGPDGVWRIASVPDRYLSVGGTLVPVGSRDRAIEPPDDATRIARVIGEAGPFTLELGATRASRTTPLSSLTHTVGGAPQRLARDRLRARLAWRGMLGGARAEAALTAAHLELDERLTMYPDAGVIRGGGLDTHGDETRGGGLLRLEAPLTARHALAVALWSEVADRAAHTDAREPNDAGEHAELVSLEERIGEAAGALEVASDWGAGWHTTAGAALEWRTDYEVALGPRVGAAWAREGVSVRGAYAEGTRAPAPYDVAALAQAVLLGERVGAAASPDTLGRARVRTLEVGTTWDTGTVRLDGAAFGARHTDALGLALDDARFRAINLAPRWIVGGEAHADADLARGRLRLAGWASIARTVDGARLGDDLAAVGAEVEGRPLGALSLGSRARAAARAGRGESAVVDVWARWERRGADGVWALIAGGRNLFGGRDAGSDPAGWPGAVDVGVPAPGRLWFVGLEAER